MILVSIEMNRFGHLELDPVSASYADKIRRWQKEQGISHARGDSAAYVQEEGDIGATLDELPPGKRRDVEQGWTVRVRMDPWTFNALAGLDNDQLKPRARKRR
jgi:hypothetical protein